LEKGVARRPARRLPSNARARLAVLGARPLTLPEPDVKAQQDEGVREQEQPENG
jgi:hypothetical protein